MSLLTPEEITGLFTSETHRRTPASFARAIEAAVIAKLASGVALPEPVAFGPYSGLFDLPQLQTAIAAARVQALEEAAKVFEPAVTDSHIAYANAIRALIGGN